MASPRHGFNRSSYAVGRPFASKRTCVAAFTSRESSSPRIASAKATASAGLEYRTGPRLSFVLSPPRYSWDTPSADAIDLYDEPDPWQNRMQIAAVGAAQESSSCKTRENDLLLPPGVAERAGWGIVDAYGYGIRFLTPTSPGTRCDPISGSERRLEAGTAPTKVAGRHSRPGSSGARLQQRPRAKSPRNSALDWQPALATTRLPRDLGPWRTPLRPCMLSPRRYLADVAPSPRLGR